MITISILHSIFIAIIFKKKHNDENLLHNLCGQITKDITKMHLGNIKTDLCNNHLIGNITHKLYND